MLFSFFLVKTLHFHNSSKTLIFPSHKCFFKASLNNFYNKHQVQSLLESTLAHLIYRREEIIQFCA